MQTTTTIDNEKEAQLKKLKTEIKKNLKEAMDKTNGYSHPNPTDTHVKLKLDAKNIAHKEIEKIHNSFITLLDSEKSNEDFQPTLLLKQIKKIIENLYCFDISIEEIKEELKNKDNIKELIKEKIGDIIKDDINKKRQKNETYLLDEQKFTSFLKNTVSLNKIPEKAKKSTNMFTLSLQQRAESALNLIKKVEDSLLSYLKEIGKPQSNTENNTEDSDELTSDSDFDTLCDDLDNISNNQLEKVANPLILKTITTLAQGEKPKKTTATLEFFTKESSQEKSEKPAKKKAVIDEKNIDDLKKALTEYLDKAEKSLKYSNAKNEPHIQLKKQAQKKSLELLSSCIKNIKEILNTQKFLDPNDAFNLNQQGRIKEALNKIKNTLKVTGHFDVRVEAGLNAAEKELNNAAQQDSQKKVEKYTTAKNIVDYVTGEHSNKNFTKNGFKKLLVLGITNFDITFDTNMFLEYCSKPPAAALEELPEAKKSTVAFFHESLQQCVKKSLNYINKADTVFGIYSTALENKAFEIKPVKTGEVSTLTDPDEVSEASEDLDLNTFALAKPKNDYSNFELASLRLTEKAQRLFNNYQSEKDDNPQSANANKSAAKEKASKFFANLLHKIFHPDNPTAPKTWKDFFIALQVITDVFSAIQANNLPIKSGAIFNSAIKYKSNTKKDKPKTKLSASQKETAKEQHVHSIIKNHINAQPNQKPPMSVEALFINIHEKSSSCGKRAGKTIRNLAKAIYHEMLMVGQVQQQVNIQQLDQNLGEETDDTDNLVTATPYTP